MTDWHERLGSDEQVCGGQLCAKGTRVPVAVILDSLGEGSTPDEILASSDTTRARPRGSGGRSRRWSPGLSLSIHPGEGRTRLRFRPSTSMQEFEDMVI